MSKNDNENKIMCLLPDDAWQTWTDILKNIECDEVRIVTDTNNINEKEPYILLLPLMAMKNGRVSPFGLEKVKELRQNKWYNFTPFFLTTEDFLDENHLISTDSPYYYKIFYEDQPNLDDSIRAVYHAELLFAPTTDIKRRWHSSGEKTSPCNLFNVFKEGGSYAGKDNILEGLDMAIKECCSHLRSWKDLVGDGEVIKKARIDFYECFVKPFNWEDTIPDQISEIFDGNAIQIMEKIDKWIHETKSGVTRKSTGHHRVGNLFRQPIPFFLWDFFRVYVNVKESFQLENQSFKMFIVDNINFCNEKDNDNKENKLKKINDLFKDYQLDSLFVTQQDENNNPLIFDAGIYTNDLRANTEENSETTPQASGKAPKRIYFKEEGGRVLLIREGAEGNSRVKIIVDFSKYILIFLDFFLSKDHQFLAYRFIRDYNAFKEKVNCFYTDWFFIVSKAYSDVLSYADAGRLSSFSSTTRVDFGDDPSDDRRRIIFLYKVLTFIHSRIESFENHYHVIYDKFLSSGQCPNFQRCKHSECFRSLQQSIKRLLAEDERFIDLIYPASSKEQKDVFNLLETTINQFDILPHADWRVIQHYIEAINSRLRAIDGSKRFSCSYIIEEIKRRSSIF